MTEQRINTPGQVLFASLIGTTIEFFDFYIYATAAVLVFPRLFFPASDLAVAILNRVVTEVMGPRRLPKLGYSQRRQML